MAQPIIKILWPITIDGTETITWDEAGTPRSTTIAAGTYYAHRDSTLNADYPSLYLAIAAAMNAISGGGYVFDIGVDTPTVSGGLNFGLTIFTASPSAVWTWQPAGTINALGVMGWATTDSNTLATSGVVTSPRTYRGAWRSPQPPTRWKLRPEAILAESSTYHERADVYYYDSGDRATRTVEVQYVCAGHVYQYRVLMPDYAAAADLATDDGNNALELVWRGGNRGQDLIVVWYDDADDLDLLADGNGRFDIMRMADVRQMREFERMLRTQRVAGEVYEVSMELVRVDGATPTPTFIN